MDLTGRNRIVSLDDMEQFFNNFKCEQCLSQGSYIITNDLWRWTDHSINVTFKCKNCSTSLVLKESNNIEIQTPGCISKTMSRSLIQLAHAATVIGLSFSQIETLLQSLEIPTPTLSIWKTSVEIACGRIKSCFTDPTYSQKINGAEQITTEAHSHKSSFVKSEEAVAIEPGEEVNSLIIKEEPPEVEVDLKEEVHSQSNMEVFMEWNDEVIVPDVVSSVPLNSVHQLSHQVTKQDMSDELDAACNRSSSSYNIETIYIKEKNSSPLTSIQNGFNDEIKYQWNANEITQSRFKKKRHINTPKRYSEDFYCEEVKKRMRSKNRYALKDTIEIDKNLVTDSKANKKIQKITISDFANNDKSTSNVEISSNKKKEKVFFDSLNNDTSINNLENISKTNFDIFEIICALCGGVCNYSKEKYSFSSLVLGFESITIKVAMQILNLLSTSKNPKCQNVCSSCFGFICSKFKFTLRKKIAEEKKIDISKVDLSKIKVRMFDYNDKNNHKPGNSTNSKKTASSNSFVPRLHYKKLVKLNSANKIKLRRIKHLSKKKDESFSRQMLENPQLSQKLKTEAVSFHPIIRLMDISPILPSEAFNGASVLINSKTDISQFC